MNLVLFFIAILGFFIYETRRAASVNNTDYDDVSKILVGGVKYWFVTLITALGCGFIVALISTGDYGARLFPFNFYSPLISECIRAFVLGLSFIPLVTSRNIHKAAGVNINNRVADSASDDGGSKFEEHSLRYVFKWWFTSY